MRWFLPTMLMVSHLVAAGQFEYDNGRYSVFARELNGLRWDSCKRPYVIADTSCKGYYTMLAAEDIAQGTPVLLGQDGMWTEIYPYDTIFERRYGVHYSIAACTLLERERCLAIYNKVIARHLDRTYGRKWRRQLRPNIFGLEKRRIFRRREY